MTTAEFIATIRPFTEKGGKPTGSLQVFKRTLLLMGSRFVISVVGSDQEVAEKQIDEAVAEIRRIEQLISSWDDHSQTAEINRQAGIQPVPVAFVLIFLCLGNAIVGQTDTSGYQKKRLQIEEVDLLFSYYHQDGNNSAVTGGLGSEKLSDAATVIKVKLNKTDRKNRTHNFGLDLGVDYFTIAIT